MNAFDFKYKKQFSGFDIFGKADVTAEVKIGQLVDSQWHYSWHWPKDINSEYVLSVSKDIDTELDYAKQRLKDLELAKSILEKLEL